MTLWSKEIREICPFSLGIMAAVIAGALLVKLLIGYEAQVPAQVTAMALLFGLIAAAAFLGAHAVLADCENGTHLFLQALPVNYRQIWLCKTMPSLTVCLFAAICFHVLIGPPGAWLSMLVPLACVSGVFASHALKSLPSAALGGFGIALFCFGVGSTLIDGPHPSLSPLLMFGFLVVLAFILLGAAYLLACRADQLILTDGRGEEDH